MTDSASVEEVGEALETFVLLKQQNQLIWGWMELKKQWRRKRQQREAPNHRMPQRRVSHAYTHTDRVSNHAYTEHNRTSVDYSVPQTPLPLNQSFSRAPKHNLT